MTNFSAPILVRWAVDGDETAFKQVVRITQHAWYAGIVSHDDIDALADGTRSSWKDWQDRRSTPVGLLVAGDGATVAGGANLVMHHDGSAELTTMYVLPEYAGRGIGIALWDGCLQALQDRGVESMQVWIAVEATWATRFYEHRGCTVFAHGIMVIGTQTVPHVGYRIAIPRL